MRKIPYVIATFGMTLAAGGSVLDALKATIISFAQMGVFSAVSSTLNAIPGVLGVAVKAVAHGIIGGAFSIAQGGSFMQGFAGGAIGQIGGAIAGGSGLVGTYGDGNGGNVLARALISGAAGCLGAIATGGKCAQAAITAAFASMYNDEGQQHKAMKSTVAELLNLLGYEVRFEVRMKDSDGRGFRADIFYYHKDDSPPCECMVGEKADEYYKSLRKWGVIDFKTLGSRYYTDNQEWGYPDYNWGRATLDTSRLESLGFAKGSTMPAGPVLLWPAGWTVQIPYPEFTMPRPAVMPEWWKMAPR